MSAPELTAVERLTLSREKLRLAMTQADKKKGDATAANAYTAGLLGLLKTTLPNASVLWDALSPWLAHYTAQFQGQTATGFTQDFLRPLAKRHPLALVLTASAVGGLVVWARPWRWKLKPQIVAAWGGTLLSGALASGALQAWILSALAKTPPAQNSPKPPAV